MIKSIPPKPINSNGFVVLDIETDENGTVLDILTSWRKNPHDNFSDIVHHFNDDWNGWFNWFRKQSQKSDRFRTIYAHNGGGFDWISLVDHLLHRNDRESFEVNCVCSGSKIINLVIKVDKECTIRCCDSLQLLRSSLSKLGKAFLGEENGKIEIDCLPAELKRKNETLYYAYLKRDCETLLKVLEKAIDFTRQFIVDIPEFGITVGSTAMKIYQTMGIETPSGELDIPVDEKVKGFLRQGYRGGRVECFSPGEYRHVSVYDINSLYPNVMRTQNVPYSNRGYWTDNFDSEKPGCYSISFKQTKTDVPALFVFNGKGCYEGEGVYYSPEISEFISQKLGEITIKTGYVFVDHAIIFKNYVDKLYELRMKNSEHPVSMICKYLLNSLYGKFGQKSERWTIKMVDNILDLRKLVADNPDSVVELSADLAVVKIKKESACKHEHVGIAGMITSMARVHLYRGMANAKGLIYVDTDSIHCTSDFNGPISDSLGEWKIEFVGEAIYAGKKLYALRNTKSGEKIRAKGVSVGGNYGANLRYDDFRLLLQGEKVECHFSQPSTVLEVIGGKKKSSVWQDRTRTLKLESTLPTKKGEQCQKIFPVSRKNA